MKMYTSTLPAAPLKLIREFEDFFESNQGFGSSLDQRVLPADVRETKESYLMSVDVPGTKEENIKLSFENNILKISIQRDPVDDDAEKSYLQRERLFGKFERSFKFLKDVDSGLIEADVFDGVLRIALPKTEQQREKKITVGKREKNGILNRLLGSSD